MSDEYNELEANTTDENTSHTIDIPDDLFSDENKPASNWFKFEKVGDKVSGVVLENPYTKAGVDDFKDQRVFVLRTQEGEEVNVGVNIDRDYLIQRTNKIRQGDIVGFSFAKEIPATKKGYSPAKSIEVYVKYTPEGDKYRDLEGIERKAS